jgi:mRNA interferase MazF
MGTPSVGEVILVPFPFSDLTDSKLRPAVILAKSGRRDWVLCQITSKPYTDQIAIEIKDIDFLSGSLRHTSFARPGKLFTANDNLIVSNVGQLKKEIFEKIVNGVITLLQAGIK